jgi:stringent starvation protein B
MATSPLPQRPYLIRAMHAWIVDSGHTPHIVVDAGQPGVAVPTQYVRDGRIVLNVSHDAVNLLDIGNETLAFSARFSGKAYEVRVPVAAVLGIYARETGRGMIFQDEDGKEPPQDSPPEPPAGPPAAGPGKSHLKVVK